MRAQAGARTHNRYDSSGRGIGKTQRHLHKTQHSQETDSHAPSGIRTGNPTKQAAADPLRPRSHRDRLVKILEHKYHKSDYNGQCDLSFRIIFRDTIHRSLPGRLPALWVSTICPGVPQNSIRDAKCPGLL
jgi:hypothetical protein